MICGMFPSLVCGMKMFWELCHLIIVAIDNHQLISIRSVKRLQRPTLCIHSKEVCIHCECFALC